MCMFGSTYMYLKLLFFALWVGKSKRERLPPRRRHPFVADTSTCALHHLSLISEELNVMYSVERLPAAAPNQKLDSGIKSAQPFSR